MQTRESALKSHLAQAIDQFLAQLQRTVTSSARLDVQSQEAAGQQPLMNGLLRPLAKDFCSLAVDWRDEQLRSLVKEAGEHLLDLSCKLEERLDRLEVARGESNGQSKAKQAAANGKGRNRVPR